MPQFTMSSVFSDTQSTQQVPRSNYFESVRYTSGIGASYVTSVSQQKVLSTRTAADMMRAPNVAVMQLPSDTATDAFPEYGMHI